jgi:hypothetical protein
MSAAQVFEPAEVAGEAVDAVAGRLQETMDWLG